MNFSRLFNFGGGINKILRLKSVEVFEKQKRGAGHAVSYRKAPINHSKATMVGAKVIGASMWWWILWHLWHEYEHITGEFYHPKPNLWSNQELGIAE